jgi:transposase
MAPLFSWEQAMLKHRRADLSGLTMLAIDETSSRRGQNYLMFAADAEARKVVFVTEGRDSKTLEEFSQFLSEHQGKPEQITSVSMDMSPAFIKGVTKHLPNARITFDKFHVVAHASSAVDQMRRLEQKTDPSLKGLRWVLLKDQSKLNESQQADLKAFTANVTTKRTARAWFYREQLREILDRKQINVASALLKRWCNNVNRSKVEPMKQVASMITKHFDGIVAGAEGRLF